MLLQRTLEKERKAMYKNLRKMRKARDIASAAKKGKKEAWKLSVVARRFKADAFRSSKEELSIMIYHYMPIRCNPPLPPLTKW